MATAIIDQDGALVKFTFAVGVKNEQQYPVEACEYAPERLRDVSMQVTEFFERKRTYFSLDLKPEGSEFQKRVWRALIQIPFGRTCSYQELAKAVGDIKATQAVGAANGRNPIALIIPCHRVIGKDGRLVGYAGGLPLKRSLLDFETPLLF